MEETDDICFVCDKQISSDKWKYKLKVTATKKRKVPAADLINHLVGEEYAVLVGERDAVCKKCMNMLNLMDTLTAQLGEVTAALKQLLHIKYNLTPDDKSIPFQVDYDDSVIEDPVHRCSYCKFETKYEKEFNMHVHKHSKTSPKKKTAESQETKNVVFSSKTPHTKTEPVQSVTTPTNVTLDPAKTGHRTRSTTNSLKKKKKISLGYEEYPPKKPVLKKPPKKPKVFFQCSLCEKMFQTESSIKIHAEAVHGKETIEVTEEEYTDIQTLESEDEVTLLDEKVKSSDKHIKPISKPKLDFLDDWQEDETNDEVTSPTKRKKTDSNKQQENQVSKYDSTKTDTKKKSRGRPRQKSSSISEEDYSEDKDTSTKPTCLFCHAVFSSVESVQDHIKMTHREKSSYSNASSKKLPDTIASLEIDSTTEALDKKQFNSRGGRVNGITNLKSYKCNMCGIKKVSLQFIQKHVKKHKRKIYLQCKFCGISCKNVVGLKVHAYKCHKVAPLAKKCGYCKFKFVKSFHLKNHIQNVHHKRKSKSSVKNENDNDVAIIDVSKPIKQMFNNDQNLMMNSDTFGKRSSVTDSRKISFSEVSSTSPENNNVTENEVQLRTPKQNTKKEHCQECSLSFDKPSQLERHATIHKLNNCLDLGICIYCVKVFLSKDQVVLHNNSVHEDLKAFPKCGSCGKTYSHLKDLKSHYVRSHDNAKIDKLIKLVIDLREGKSSEVLNNSDSSRKATKSLRGTSQKQNHIDSDVANKNFESSTLSYSCPLCNFDSEDKGKVRNHLSTHTKNYCHICNDIFSSQDSIKHIENHSVLFEGKKCSECDGQFHDDIHLQLHIQNVHPTVKKAPNKCSMCTNTYLSQRSLLIHKHKRHAKKTVKVLSCSHCRMKYFSEKKLQIHIEFAHRPSLNCKYCDKGFDGIKSLVCHEKNHLKQVKSIYKCSMCGKVLKSLLTLKIHKANHAGGTTLQCNVCGRSFKSFCALREHSAKHSDTLKMKYFCDICGKGFYFYDSHCRHRRIHLELLKFQ